MIMFTPWLTPEASRIKSDETNPNGYEALTPTVLEPEKASSYVGALNYAFYQPDIRNIAVTGPYGAGKSSVLKTWCRTQGETLSVLTVSLADFDMQKQASDDDTDDDKGKKGEDGKNEVTSEKSIEYSILQQILYKNKKNELPYSRIERISGVTFEQILKSAALLTLTIMLAGVALFFLAPDYLTAKLSLPVVLSQFLLECPFAARLSGAVLSVLSALALLLYQLYRTGIFDRKVSLDKVDIIKGAVTTKASSPSLLNVYIDEIVYFFDSTKYNVVIFEDLDRLNNNRIFIKLREINQIINNCLSDRNPLKFIYAVRDDLFSSAESRTKFFDFVIPVIPVMDSDNASDHFSNKFTEEEKSQKGLNECISRIATFIPDMRVMHNITNEFRLYQNIVNNRENTPKLLAMIAYKNLCAEDYHSIDKKGGIVFSFMDAYVERRIHQRYLSEVDTQITSEQNHLNLINNERNTHREALRKELLASYINQTYKDKLSFYTNTILSLKQVIEDEEIFILLVSGEGFNIIDNTRHNTILQVGLAENKGIRSAYEERCSLIDDKTDDGIARIKNSISSLEREKRNIRAESVSGIIHRMRKSDFSDWVRKTVNGDKELNPRMAEQLDFIYFLLSSDYLATDYMSFRSVFMPGALTENDNAFIKSVMAGDDANESFTIPLENLPHVVIRLKKLGVIERDNAQHPDVIRWLLDNEPGTLAENTSSLLSQAGSERTVSLLDLIQAEFSTKIRLRYSEIFMQDEKMLHKLLVHFNESAQTVLVDEMTAHLLCLNKYYDNWRNTEIHSLASRLIYKSSSLIDSIPEGHEEDFFNTLNINRFTVSHIPLATSGKNQELIRKMSSEGLIAYSAQNLENIYLSLTQSRDGLSFSRTPLQCLESLNISALIKLVNDNIDDFATTLFVESTETNRVSDLLNAWKISLNAAEQIIMRMHFIINDISLIKNQGEFWPNNPSVAIRNTYSLLLSHDHILPSIENFIHLLEDEMIDTAHELVSWVNENNKAIEPCSIILTSTEVFDKFLVQFIVSPDLSDNSLQIVMECFEIIITEIPINIPVRNAEVLCSLNKLAPTIHVFKALYNALSGEADNLHRMNILLSNLIAQRPELLSVEPEDILYNDKKFDVDLARELFSNELIGINIRVSTLRWLRDNDPNLVDAVQLLPLDLLTELSPWMYDDSLRLPLLKSCLSAGDADKEMLQTVLSSFADEGYHSLLPHERFRKFPRTDELWALAELLSETGLIQPPKMGSGRDEQKMVITPIRSEHEDDAEEAPQE
ncbi:hypothetical protein KPL62_18625 [Enterobacter ludwigii]